MRDQRGWWGEGAPSRVADVDVCCGALDRHGAVRHIRTISLRAHLGARPAKLSKPATRHSLHRSNMGWLWGSSGSSNAQKDLDPSLQDFLNREAPVGPTPALPSSPPVDTPKKTAPPV